VTKVYIAVFSVLFDLVNNFLLTCSIRTVLNILFFSKVVVVT